MGSCPEFVDGAATPGEGLNSATGNSGGISWERFGDLDVEALRSHHRTAYRAVFFLSAGWLAVPAIILIIQVVTDRPGRLLLAITGRSGRLRH
jgi:hypothetical protein